MDVEWTYGYDLARATGLQSGTLYPILARLHDRGQLIARWEEEHERSSPEGPRRHLYRLSDEGRELAREVRRVTPTVRLRPREAL